MTLVEEYISQYPQEIQLKMKQMYALIKECAPEAKEKMSWGMPTFDYFGNLVHFAYAKHHLGFYPGASGVLQFENQLTAYKHSKGAIQFPYTQELPEELIRQIILFRVKENEKNK